jgi:hypothetical protein
VHVVVNHLCLREPLPDELVEAAQGAVEDVVDAGGLAAQVARADADLRDGRGRRNSGNPPKASTRTEQPAWQT